MLLDQTFLKVFNGIDDSEAEDNKEEILYASEQGVPTERKSSLAQKHSHSTDSEEFKEKIFAFLPQDEEIVSSIRSHHSLAQTSDFSDEPLNQNRDVDFGEETSQYPPSPKFKKKEEWGEERFSTFRFPAAEMEEENSSPSFQSVPISFQTANSSSPIPETNAERILESAQSVFLKSWPESVLTLRNHGDSEFAHLADIIANELAAGNKIFGFGGLGRNIGTSTILLGLTNAMTFRRLSVLVIDANFEAPALSEILKIKADLGWENIVNTSESIDHGGLIKVSFNGSPKGKKNKNEDPYSDVRHFDSFHLLPLNSSTVVDAVTVSCKKIWLQTILELSESFDLVFIDHGSLLSSQPEDKVSEIFRFGSDGYFFIDDLRQDSEHWKETFFECSEARRLPCFGVIENFT